MPVGVTWMEKLVLDGGKPVRNSFLPYAEPLIGNEEILEVSNVIRSGWLSRGPKTTEFEENFKNYIKSDFAVAVNSCTAGMHASLLALGIKYGDEVITSTFTFVATAHVIAYTGAKPVLVDINPLTYNMDINDLRRKITDKTKAIMPVHFAGQPCDMREIQEIAKEHDLAIVEDAAHAAGAEYDGKKIGSLGNLTCFSFYPTKNMTAAEGGMVTTNDNKLAKKIRKLSFYGIDRSPWERYEEGWEHGGKRSQWYYDAQELGYRYYMIDIQAAIGLMQLKKLDEFNRVRREYAKYLSSALSKLNEIRVPLEKEGRKHCWHLFPIVINTDLLRIDRNKFIKVLAAENIGAGVHFIPVHKHRYYQRCYGYNDTDFPVANRIFNGIVSLPLYPKMTRADLEAVVTAVHKVVERYRK